MLTAWRELQRRPGRFAVATAALALLAILLLLLGALLDGLFLGSTGAIRSQDADVFVYSAAARDSFLRSRITPELRRAVEQVDGVMSTGGLGLSLLGARVPGESEVANVALFGYERATDEVPAPPPPGRAWADRRLRTAGVRIGDRLEIGPAREPVTVDGWVDDTSFLLQGALWVEPETWRRIQQASRPDEALGDGAFQVLGVRGPVGADPAALARRIDAATAGATRSLTRAEAVFSLPGTRQQSSTFQAIILVTFFVTGLVVALFFALLTLEHVGLYGVLKAVGASSGRLAGGVIVQAVVVSVLAFAVGGLLTIALARFIPPEVPVQFEPTRALYVAIGILVASVLGSIVSLRRVVHIDPASAIGRAS